MTPRTEEVRSPSGRAETLAVLQAAAAIAVAALAVIAASRPAPAGGAGPRLVATPGQLGVDEVRFTDLPAAEQRMFRQVQEGVLEAENARGRSGAWPEVAALRDQGIPPFALDPLDRAGYTWTLVRRGPVVNYAGTPTADPGRPAFLVLIVEPDPGTPVDPRARADEIHHLLPDGQMMHVSTWIGPGPLTDLPLAVAPVERGWRRVAVSVP